MSAEQQEDTGTAPPDDDSVGAAEYGRIMRRIFAGDSGDGARGGAFQSSI